MRNHSDCFAADLRDSPGHDGTRRLKTVHEPDAQAQQRLTNSISKFLSNGNKPENDMVT